MMKRTVFALLALALTAMPGFAADNAAPDMKTPGMSGDMKQMGHEHPDMKRHMMGNPQHLLAMAYHKNLVSFALALKKVAQHNETVPRDFARAAITEMRRSADQMEINHEEAMRSMPAEMKAKHGEMAKKMGAHLAEMRTQLAQLEDLSKKERIDSKELLPHLQIILKGCEGMCRAEGMCGKGMPGAGRGGKGMHGKGMGCGCGQGWKMRGGGMEGRRDMMQERQKLMAEMKAQDAEIARLADKMNAAPNDQKQAIIAEILTRMVKQRSAMSAHMDKMQEHMNRHHMEGAPMSPCSMQHMEGDEDSGDADLTDGGSDDSGAMDADDSESGGDNMDMKEMNMQGK